MTKIMLVEDDNNLREIYEARLLTEGYEIVNAKDGEEALAIAMKEKPDLIIADIMMPRISGFDMLDILRNTPEIRDTKVIMMTALSQAEDKDRANKLGADRYLVKSQATLEDVAKVAREVLGGEEAPTADTTPPAVTASPPAPDAATPIAASTPSQSDTPAPSAISTPTGSSSSSTQIDPSLAATLQEEETTVKDRINDFAATDSPATPAATPAQNDSSTLEQPMPASTELATSAPAIQIDVKDAPVSGGDTAAAPKAAEKDEPANYGNVPIARKKVIEPINDMTQTPPNLNQLMAKEDQKEAVSPIVQPDTTLPVEAVIQPGGATTAPSNEAEDTRTHKPGNVVTPGGGIISDTGQQPSDIAL